MGRKSLLAGVVAGLVAAAAITGGVLAVFRDEATTGTGSPQDRDRVETAERNKEVDIALATRSGGVCGTFSDDLTSALVSFTDVSPSNDPAGTVDFCVRNQGEQTMTELRVEHIGLQQVELGCTGDEGQVDPDGPECGTSGEAAASMTSTFVNVRCDSGVVVGQASIGVTSQTDIALPMTGVEITPGETECYQVLVFFTGAPDPIAQQSDAARWRYRFSTELG